MFVIGDHVDDDDDNNNLVAFKSMHFLSKSGRWGLTPVPRQLFNNNYLYGKWSNSGENNTNYNYNYKYYKTTNNTNTNDNKMNMLFISAASPNGGGWKYFSRWLEYFASQPWRSEPLVVLHGTTPSTYPSAHNPATPTKPPLFPHALPLSMVWIAAPSASARACLRCAQPNAGQTIGLSYTHSHPSTLLATPHADSEIIDIRLSAGMKRLNGSLDIRD